MRCPVVIHKDADSDYGVSFPDFPSSPTKQSNLNFLKNSFI
jgi:predicted RNase H-like HicB family nuclease